ncbi:unnamed protein product [Somion occarium]|uniref:BTB domain-containing protein n=1 Tax=Somion occarium TaxID=3059160 RepID=A0ABP1EB20_9APHY
MDAYIRHHDFWFDDGNIVILAEDTVFRLHRGVLARHSEVFRDMFGLAQPLNEHLIDELPVVEVLDTSEDFTILLSVLYDGDLRRILGAREPLPFPTVSAFLRLGFKYHIAVIREEAIYRLGLCFPTTLEDYDPDIFMQREMPDVRRIKRGWLPIALKRSDAIEVVNLAHSFDLDNLLPSAYYVCAQLPTFKLCYAVEENRLDTLDLIRIFDGHKELTMLEFQKTSVLFQQRTSEQCKTVEFCQTIMGDIALEYHPDKETLTFQECFKAPKDDGSWWKSLADDGLCQGCLEHVSQEYAEEINWIWSNLAEIFALDIPWPPSGS